MVQLDEVARKREAEARAASASPPSVLGLIELMENPLQLVRGNADALIGDGDAHRVDRDQGVALRHEAAGDGDDAAMRRELHRVREQIEQDLFEPSFIQRHLGDVQSVRSRRAGSSMST